MEEEDHLKLTIASKIVRRRTEAAKAFD